MPKGPEEQKLEAWLRGSHEGVVDGGGRAWLGAGILLDRVQMSIELAARQVTGLGGDTGPAASAAFVKAAEAMGKKAAELRLGGSTLGATAGVVGNARGRYAAMGEPPVEPSAPAPPAPGSPPSDKDLQKQAAYRSDLATYQDQSQAREAHCKAITDDMTAQYQQSTADMKKIHGEPDPAPRTTTTTSGGGGTTSPSGGGSRTWTTTSTTHHASTTTTGPSGTTTHTSGTSGPAPTHTATGPGPAGTTTTGSHYPSGTAQSSWSETGPGSGVPGGTALPGVTAGAAAPASSMGAGAGITGSAGLVGGLAASGLSGNLTGGLRGGITPVSTSAAGVRPIGSAARTGATGTLGRGTTTVGSGTGSSGSGASRSGGRSGSRGAAGGRGTGGTGRGGDRTRDRSKKSQRDHLDEEWEIEDEDVAPPVLD